MEAGESHRGKPVLFFAHRDRGGKKVKGNAQDFSLFSLWVVVAACRELDCLPLAAVEVAVGKTTTRPVLCSIS
jgi:hypothetical protein